MSLVTHRCWCSIEHAIPSELDRQARENGHGIYCPLGHVWAIRETELDRERRQRQRLEQENARLAEQAAMAEQERMAAAAELKRHKTRAAAGLCPCCNRTFVNVARHMKTKHRDYNVTPLTARAA